MLKKLLSRVKSIGDISHNEHVLKSKFTNDIRQTEHICSENMKNNFNLCYVIECRLMTNKNLYLIELGERIVALRKDKGLRQIDLSARIGIEDSALRRIEKGKVNSTILMLRKIAFALEIEVSELVDIKRSIRLVSVYFIL